MKLKFKEDPKEWRKAAWMAALGLALLSSLLHWRRKLPTTAWVAVLAFLALWAIAAAARPALFRGYYRFGARAGFAITRLAGGAILTFFFIFIITPLGLVMRMMGKDPLRLRRPPAGQSCWSDLKQKPSLDRLF